MRQVTESRGAWTACTTWQFEAEGAAPVDVYTPYASIGYKPDKLLLTGLGETDVDSIAGRLSDWGVTGLAVASLVYPEVRGDFDPEAVGQVIVKGTEALMREITRHGGDIQHAIGNSEGANQILMAAYKNPDLYGHVTAIAPALNNTALGDTPKRQMKTLLGRFNAAGLELGGNGNRQVDRIALVKEMKGGLAYAAEQDATEIIQALGSNVRIYTGEKDLVVPPAEGECPENGVGDGVIRRIPGMGHPTLLDETGARQVALVLEMERHAGIVH